MRLIDGHILMERLQEQTAEVTSPIVASGLLMAQMVVLNAPTIDAEPVVRCKNCKHYIDPHIEDELGVRCVQWHTARFTREDDFCSYGERREK